MTIATNHPFAKHLAQVPDSRLVQADQPTCALLICMAEAEELPEHYLASSTAIALTGECGLGLRPSRGYLAIVSYRRQPRCHR